MAAPTTKTASETVTDSVKGFVTGIPAMAQKSREQLVSNLQQGQQFSVDAAQSWVNAMTALPGMDLPKIPGLPAVPDFAAATTFTFDMATDVLNAQRDFALQLGKMFVPAKS